MPAKTARRTVRRLTKRRRKPAAKRHRFLTTSQRRELIGTCLSGLGIILLAILLIPGGGSVASTVHDATFSDFGFGAWLVGAAMLISGLKISKHQQWRAGLTAATGAAVALVAALGLLGVWFGSGGIVGASVAGATLSLLGGFAGSTALLVMVSAGLLLAMELKAINVAGKTALLIAGSIQQALRNREPKVELSGRVALHPITNHLPLVDIPETAIELPAEPEPLVINQQGAGLKEVEEDDQPKIDFDALPHTLDLEGERSWTLPSVDLLEAAIPRVGKSETDVRAVGELIVNTLLSFGIETRIVGANTGPTVTQFELQPAKGVPVRKIVNYQTDLSLAVAAPVRIQPLIPGKSAIGIEVPNKATQLVTLREVVSAPAFSDTRNTLPIALGADVSGRAVVGDLTKMPHLLIAGATGSGKSVCINAILAGLMLGNTPEHLKMILIDPKRVELSGFADLPHLMVPVVVEPKSAVASLRWAVHEMEERYKLFSTHAARNIAIFNEKAPELGLSPLPYILIVIDELADLMMVAAGEMEDLVCRIAQLARAVGIHLIVATQRPSADIITGLIKANIPTRVAFAVSSGVDSRVILDETGAEKLLGRGDMLYLPVDEGKPRRLQGAFVNDRELEAVINFWKSQGLPDYQEEIFSMEPTVTWAKEANKRDPLFPKAANTVAVEGRAAASLLQRKLGVGYTRAARLVDQLADYGVVGPFEGSKSRDVLMTVMEVDEMVARLEQEDRQT